MKNITDSNNLTTLIIWSSVGLLAGGLFGNWLGLDGKQLIFPAVIGFVVASVASYRYMMNGNRLESSESYSELMKLVDSGSDIKESNESQAIINRSPQKMGHIEGVIITPLNTFPDDRGYFREIFRFTDTPLNAVAQVSATMSYPGVIKAFHYHNIQDDLWYCAKGMIEAVMYDRRPDSLTYKMTQVVPMGDLKPQTLFIPHGVVHGYKVLGPEAALVVYATTQVYDPNDELRIAHDDPEIGFDWGLKPR